MANSIKFLFSIFLLTAGIAASSQKYKRAEDTVRLNKEYVKVSNRIAELTSDLSVAQNRLADYQSKSKNATTDAQDAAASSSNQAAKAENGSVKEAKRAKKRANRAYGEAKDAKSAENNLERQNNKISRLTEDLGKSQKRLQELDAMRAAITNQTTSATQNQ